MNSDIFDLRLPEVGAGEGPKPLFEPDHETQMAHARWILAQHPPEYWEAHRRRPSSEPFRM